MTFPQANSDLKISLTCAWNFYLELNICQGCLFLLLFKIFFFMINQPTLYLLSICSNTGHFISYVRRLSIHIPGQVKTHSHAVYVQYIMPMGRRIDATSAKI
jgi:hypothetical protein